MTRAVVLFYICVTGIPYGTMQSDATLLSETGETLELARAKLRSGDLDEAIALVRPYASLNQDEGHIAMAAAM